MKKLATVFIVALMVTGLTTSAFAFGPSGHERGQDSRNYQIEKVRGAHHIKHGHGWNHHVRYGHSHNNRLGHDLGR